jgi:hypothetical protein
MSQLPTGQDENRFGFRFTAGYQAAARPFGITPERAWVSVGRDRLEARYGPWRISTPLTNLAQAKITGPYSFLKTAGPAHLGVTDRGLTFASNGQQGLELHFRQPVQSSGPFRMLRHPNVTLTVTDPPGLLTLLRSRQPTLAGS